MGSKSFKTGFICFFFVFFFRIHIFISFKSVFFGFALWHAVVFKKFCLFIDLWCFAPFKASLNKLMETLGQSEPYFVKCIRSNAEKVCESISIVSHLYMIFFFTVWQILAAFQLPLRFNDGLVLRQLRYTGMLETVRIRQSGYSIKYTFQVRLIHTHWYLL